MFLTALILASVLTTKADVPRLTPAELQPLMEKGEAVVIDVRGSVPWELGHIAGAVWMPLGVLNQRAGELPEDKLIVSYCSCRVEETSLDAAMRLSELGFKRVAVLHGGYPAWTKAGLPTESREVAEEPQSAGEASAPASRGGRLAPPAGVLCGRDQLTSYSGRVTRYVRSKGSTTLTIATTADTVEEVRLSHPGSDDPSRFFLLSGTPMTPRDWNRIESKRGVLRKDLHVVAWVCEDGKAVVDFRPGAAAGPGE